MKLAVALCCLVAVFTRVSVAATPAVVPNQELVDVRSADPTIAVDLRYATARNIAGHPIYPPGMPALVRPDVALRLAVAQQFLRKHRLGLKIWDAYRPRSAQQLLWAAARNDSYVANPSDSIGSMHTRGVAVDATLVDERGNDVEMPTDFDNFTPAAMLRYTGSNPRVKTNLTLLQCAMARAGFYGLRTEWWHFCAADWSHYQPIDNVNLSWQTQRKSR